MSVSRFASAPETSPNPVDLVRRRYGSDQPVATAEWNAALDTILSHRSVRTYLPKPVPESVLQLIVAAAQSAPTSSSLQAWSVVAVEDQERRAKLAELASPNPQIISAPLFLVWIADLSRLRKITAQNGKTGEGLDYLESFLLATIDASLAAQNALVALESLGLGTCYIGGIRNHPAEVSELLGLPPEALAVFGMTVGYPDPAVETEVKPRLPQSVVLHREQYQAAPPEADLATYDDTMRSFQTGQGMAVRGWTSVVASRIADAPALKGRHVLLDVVRRMGFKVK
ncbi:NADPH-dependent oxidoreductase [Neorhizobium galegae]|uniref:NADPH-dependent oxidoreductase n=1 Tax=Neorhizobium galegae TaxID=399 RepID=UPI0006222E62|nr:NADPH-dependent oxidoreductase [Neorhizobium galegae]MCQ1768222.1 NADPH-dependent oxidoreductase [Neorhizobium galegae]MCQ1847194.1 NADPH-dependent oxidoreductase [Neorhizobium galegae]CDZ29788.1 CR(VI) reductase [Neorhizobium galegae bv. officinalis]CDZ34390.1 CR(VI) reductase [Neorhizobium galegae bv. officinalis]